VFPCVPKGKRPLGGLVPNGYLDASNDEATILRWWKAKPDANVAIACGASNLTVTDCDHGLTTEAEARAWIKQSNLPETYAVHTGRRVMRDGSGRPEYGVQLYYSKAIPGSGTFDIHGASGDIQSIGDYVMAAGSIHPDSGEAYEALIDAPVVPVPDWIEKLAPVKHASDAAATVSNAEADAWKTWLLEYADHNKIPLRDYEKRAPNGWWLGIKCPWEHRSGDGEDSSTVLGILDGKVAFECSHGTCKASKRDTALFKAEMVRLHGEYSVPEPGADPLVVFGRSKVELVPATLPERTRPVYPISAWDGTAVGAFAKLCGGDNNVPLKMYAEAFRCVLGAVVGDRISCPTVEGVLPRTYTILVAPKGKGKGTAIRRAVQFFSRPCDGWSNTSSGGGGGVRVSFSDPLLSGKHDFMWKPKGIGAYSAAASSVPGMARLIKEPDATAKNKPQFTWGGTLPRVLSVHEEMKTFLSALFIEGGVGSGLEGVVCQLWDDVTFNGTATGTREALYGEMMFSMLCGVTEQDWFDLLSHGNAVGSGLLSRFNIIGTEGGFDNVSKMKPPDFAPLQETFLRRIMQLEDAQVRVVPSEGADHIISEWADNLPDGSERMNIHAWRSALLIAWLRHEDTISEKTAEDAVKLGQYQIASHEYYRPNSADTANARVQAKILRVLEMKGTVSRRELERATHKDRDGTELWNRALNGLIQDRTVGKREDGAYYLAS
jgi:hypothetical protein